MVETNISLYEAKKKYPKSFIYYRKRVDLEEGSDLCDVVFIGIEGEMREAKTEHKKESGFRYGVTRGIHARPFYRSGVVKVIRK